MEVEGDGSATPSVTVAHELQASNKLTVLNQFLTSLRFLNETKSVKDKVVIVSNFIKTLDKINMLANSKRWPLLRLDGNTKPQERVALVNKFNTGPYFLMLLSAKAGGVGLNLTGANRLILVDPDWNPATDLQALGRIWREGQTKPVFIYRLLSSDTIDESILRRQKDKGILTSVIQHETDRGDDATKENEEDFVEEVVSDCNILSLILPNGTESFSLEDNSEKGDSKDRTPSAGVVQDELFSINDMPNYFSKILEE
jgi:SNF2 family DNA or RNA helicase